MILGAQMWGREKGRGDFLNAEGAKVSQSTQKGGEKENRSKSKKIKK
jgi:hypothetical protein